MSESTDNTPDVPEGEMSHPPAEREPSEAPIGSENSPTQPWDPAAAFAAWEETAVTLVEEENRDEKFIYSVLLAQDGKASDFYWNQIDLKVGDLVVVEGKNGLQFGSVAVSRRPVFCGCPGKKARRGRVYRRATEEDTRRAMEHSEKERKALAYCRERIARNDLEMSLSSACCSYDGSRITFYYTSDARVDFRDLVRDLAGFTKAKVEMRQIGVRDEAKLIGGCGACGTQLCCSSFLDGFAPVSIRMAKDQNLSLNPAKISGVCGRLMCCLGFEHKLYKELQAKAPKLHKMATTEDGRPGRVITLNLLQERVTLMFEDGVKEEFHISAVTRGAPQQRKKGRPAEGEETRTERGGRHRPEQRQTIAEPPQIVSPRPPQQERAASSGEALDQEKRKPRKRKRNRRRAGSSSGSGGGESREPLRNDAPSRKSGGAPRRGERTDAPAPQPAATGGEEASGRSRRRNRRNRPPLKRKNS